MKLFNKQKIAFRITIGAVTAKIGQFMLRERKAKAGNPLKKMSRTVTEYAPINKILLDTQYSMFKEYSIQMGLRSRMAEYDRQKFKKPVKVLPPSFTEKKSLYKIILAPIVGFFSILMSKTFL